MRYTTRERLRTILAEVTSISPTVYTAAPMTPRGRQPYEGYVAYARLTTNRPTFPNADQVNNATRWLITLLSPDVGLGLDYDVEGFMLQYADAITALFQERSQLQTSAGVGLTGVRNVLLGEETFNAPAPFPEGQSTSQFYRWTMPLDIQLIHSRTC
jgi:hypothetical protein